jgi:hypothetical protein
MRAALVVVATSSALLSSHALALAAAPATPAPIMTMVEQDLDGDTYPVPHGRATIDINSAVAITIDKAAVAKAVVPSSGSATAALASDYATFQKAVAQIAAALTVFTKETTDLKSLPTAERVKRRQELVRTIRPVADAIDPLLKYAKATATGTTQDPAAQARRTAFLQALNKALDIPPGTSIAAQDQIILQTAQGELQRLQAELNTALQKEGVNLVMGAWIGTTSGATPVHLPNFDDYPELPRTEIDRFKVVFTAEQQQQYQDAQAAASMINGGQASDAARQIVTALIDQYFSATRDSLKALQAALQDLRQVAQPPVGTLLNDLSALDQLLTADLQWLQQTITTLEGMVTTDPSGLLTAIEQDWNDLKTRAKAVEDSIQKIDGDVAKAAAAIKAALVKVDTALQDVKTSAAGDVTNLASAIGRAINGVELNAATLAFGDKIRRFDIDTLPLSTRLDAERAGARSEGDELVVKFGIERPNTPTIDADVQSLIMRRLMLHVQTAAGLVFTTRPRLPQDGDKKVPFQAAPSYSAFLKKGWRGCPFWNNLLAPGIGINVAALDFDLDGVPEVGVGAAISLLRDWLQGGVGYNLFQRRWYGFVGIGLPLPTFGMVTTNNSGAGGAPATSSPK